MPRNSQRVHTTKVDVPLACGHLGTFTDAVPKDGESVYCRKCSDYTKVKGDVQQPLRLICDGCAYNRPYGQDKLLVYRKANSHLVRFPSHRMSIWEGVERLEDLNTGNIGTLLRELSESLTKTHQQAFKNLVTELGNRKGDAVQ